MAWKNIDALETKLDSPDGQNLNDKYRKNLNETMSNLNIHNETVIYYDESIPAYVFEVNALRGASVIIGGVAQPIYFGTILIPNGVAGIDVRLYCQCNKSNAFNIFTVTIGAINVSVANLPLVSSWVSFILNGVPNGWQTLNVSVQRLAGDIGGVSIYTLNAVTVNVVL